MVRRGGSFTLSGSTFTESSSSVGSVSVRPDASLVLYELTLGLGLGEREDAENKAPEEPWTNSGDAARLGWMFLQRTRVK